MNRENPLRSVPTGDRPARQILIERATPCSGAMKRDIGAGTMKTEGSSSSCRSGSMEACARARETAALPTTRRGPATAEPRRTMKSRQPAKASRGRTTGTAAGSHRAEMKTISAQAPTSPFGPAAKRGGSATKSGRGMTMVPVRPTKESHRVQEESGRRTRPVRSVQMRLVVTTTAARGRTMPLYVLTTGIEPRSKPVHGGPKATRGPAERSPAATKRPA
jgi:hypothetical protein